MIKIITLLYLSILCTYGLSQEWVNYTNYNSIYDIVNHRDVLWIATHGGLVKFHKQSEEIEYFNRANAGIPDNQVAALALDAAGNIWLGTQRYGVGKFDGANCTVYNTYNSGLPHDQWNHAIATDKQGNMWMGSLRYLSKFDGENWSVYETGDPISSYIAIHDIQFDFQGNGWIGASWGLGKFAGDSLIQGYAKIVNDVMSIALDNEIMWFGTNGSGLIKFDGINTSFYDTTNSDIPGNIIYSAKVDSKDILWLATGKGLVSFDGVSWQVYNTANSGLLEDVIFALEIDEADKIWLGLMSKGLVSYDGVEFKSFFLGNKGFPSNNIYDIEFDKNEIAWFGTYKGLVKFDYVGWSHFDSTNSGLKNQFLLSLEVDRFNNIWMGSRGYNCLTKFYQNDWFVYDSTNSLLTIEEIVKLQVDSLDNLWIASSRGITKYDGENWIRYTTKNTPLTSNEIHDLEFDADGSLWVALGTLPFLDYIGGLAKFNGENWIIYNTENSGLPINHVVALAFDSEGLLWISTKSPGFAGIEIDGGLTKFDGENWTTYTIYNSGLSSNTIFDVFVDSVDNIWLATYAGGLVRFDREDEWLVYNTRNSGISSNKISVINIDSKGNKWIGHLFSGISVFREGGVIITDTINGHPHILNKFTLFQNYPNPFNDQTIISYQLPKSDFVELIIYNTLGQKIRTMVNNPQSIGQHNKSWDGMDDLGKKTASGLYVYVLKINNEIKSRKMVLLK